MKRIVIGLAAAVFLATSTAMADAPGRGLFNKLYGPALGGSSESECPPGGCASGDEQAQPGLFGRLVDLGKGQSEVPKILAVEMNGEQVVKEGKAREGPPTVAVRFGNASSGASGVVLAMHGHQAAILTAYHVVQGQSAADIPVQVFGKQLTATICRKADGSHAVRKVADLALVQVTIPDNMEPFHSLAYAQPDVGDTVWVSGFGSQGIYRELPGAVQQYGMTKCQDKGFPLVDMVIAGAARPGDSGGPIFDTEYRVCGIVSQGTHGPNNSPHTHATSLEEICTLCADTKFPFPWRKEVEKELEEAKQLPVPYPQAPPAGLSVKAEARISAMEARIEAIVNEYGPRFERVEGVAEAAVTAAENASTDAGKQFATDVALLKTETETAGKAAEKAASAVEKVAAVVEEEKEERSKLGTIIDGVREKVALPRKAAAWTVGKIATVTGIPVAGVVIVGLGICVVLWRRKVKPMVQADIAAYRETGDDTFVQDLADNVPGRLGRLIQAGVDRAVERHLGPAGGAAEPEAAPAKKKARRTK